MFENYFLHHYHQPTSACDALFTLHLQSLSIFPLSLKFPENQNRGRLQLHPIHYPERNDHTATHLDHVKLLQQGPEHAEPARPDILCVCGES